MRTLCSDDMMACFAQMRKEKKKLYKKLSCPRKKYYSSFDSRDSSDSEQDDGFGENSVEYKVSKIDTNVKAELNIEHTPINIVLIKFVDINVRIKWENIIYGTGLVISVAVKLTSLRVLLDSGSDGDLLFEQESTNTYVPFKEHYAPQKW